MIADLPPELVCAVYEWLDFRSQRALAATSAHVHDAQPSEVARVNTIAAMIAPSLADIRAIEYGVAHTYSANDGSTLFYMSMRISHQRAVTYSASHDVVMRMPDRIQYLSGYMPSRAIGRVRNTSTCWDMHATSYRDQRASETYTIGRDDTAYRRDQIYWHVAQDFAEKAIFEKRQDDIMMWHKEIYIVRR